MRTSKFLEVSSLIAENLQSFHPHSNFMGALIFEGLSKKEVNYVKRKYDMYWESLSVEEFCNALSRWYTEGISQEGFKVFDLFPAQTRNLVNYLLTKDISYIYKKVDWSNNCHAL